METSEAIARRRSRSNRKVCVSFICLSSVEETKKKMEEKKKNVSC